jgi:hypothetical protein
MPHDPPKEVPRRTSGLQDLTQHPKVTPPHIKPFQHTLNQTSISPPRKFYPNFPSWKQTSSFLFQQAVRALRYMMWIPISIHSYSFYERKLIVTHLVVDYMIESTERRAHRNHNPDIFHQIASQQQSIPKPPPHPQAPNAAR